MCFVAGHQECIQQKGGKFLERVSDLIATAFVTGFIIIYALV